MIPGDFNLIIEGINPAPWTAPEVSVGRRGGKPFPQVHKKAELRTYQDAIKEVLGWDEDAKERTDDGLWTDPMILEPMKMKFYFWRRIEKYERTNGTLVRKHKADATNLQKALEDAMQGIVMKNDNQVQSVQSVIVEEGDEVEPLIIVTIHLQEHVAFDQMAGVALREFFESNER